MLLSDRNLKELASKHEFITPFNENFCEGATINLTLHPQIKVYKAKEQMVMVDKIDDGDLEMIDISEKDFHLKPNQSVLVQASEKFNIPTNMSAVIFERYSIKLLGLVVSPASYMNPGFRGRLSFLLTNNSPSSIQLIHGIKFCQLGLLQLSSESDKPYDKQDAKYMDSDDVHISKLHLDKEIQDYIRENGNKEISTSSARQLGKHLFKEMDKNAKKYADIIRSKIGEFNGPIT